MVSIDVAIWTVSCRETDGLQGGHAVTYAPGRLREPARGDHRGPNARVGAHQRADSGLRQHRIVAR